MRKDHSYSFDGNEAQRYGIPESIFLEELRRWIKHNRVKKHNIRDGFVWVYNTLDEWAEAIPIMSKRQIQRIISDLRESGTIMSEQYGGADGNLHNRVNWLTILNFGEVIDSQIDIPSTFPRSCIVHEDVPSKVHPGVSSKVRDDVPCNIEESELHTEEQAEVPRAPAADSEDEKQKTPHVLPEPLTSPIKIVRAFYERCGKPEPATPYFNRDILCCQAYLDAGYTGDQILEVPDFRPDTDIASFKYVSLDLLANLYPKEETRVDMVPETNERTARRNAGIPATDEERQASIDECKAQLKATRHMEPEVVS